MKKVLFLIGGLLSSLVINAQVISNFDGAVLFSQEDVNGTARFNAMGGAFGSLGGDMSAADINPAGLAVFNNSQAAITLGLRNTDILTSYYGTTTSNSDSFLNLMQAGGVLVFNTPRNSNWTKFALGFNYSLAKDFENGYIIEGVGDLSEYNGDPYLNNDNDPGNDVFYNNIDGQFFSNYMDGENSKFTISFAGEYDDKFSLGLSLVTHKLDHFQRGLFEESNNDGNGNLLDASYLQELRTYGQGVGLNVGLIAKPVQELRLGLAFQTPTWYNLTEEYSDDLEIQVSNDSRLYTEFSDVNIFEYNLVTPAKATASIAYLFGKSGLVSLDYTFKNYSQTKLKPTSDFVDINESFKNDLQNASEIRIGGEWRVGKILSLRGGYFYQQSPYADAIDTDHVQGFSLGTGFNFNRKIKLDLAYQKSTNTGVYGFTEFSNPAELDIDNGKVTATLVIGL
ncbi:outer membrane protein transport protein [Aureibaculum sp. 2210JD6-5]|uniref:OmpP1/FadL family transporter n=1 Tax=Aureibaculum sp. 2210JD6-5 TaxID=3103957 RepID=UPI002AAD1803|nr:outer membrane protein transport protein [Aureibaculum sp. 2210JD6-5]MDY7395312.1 outer membrane protein transport protein [Aureibaculum sp. 2210JD6-5]